ncbi:MAG: GNAT family N-acetyltransferase [Planctomycetota bacterium]
MKETLSIRSFLPGDAEALCRIFTDTYDAYNGFMPKDPTAWERSFTGHPEIGPGRVLVAEEDGRIRGYAAYGCRTHLFFRDDRLDSTIYDLCADQGPGARAVARTLLAEALRRGRAEGLHRFNIDIPTGNRPVYKALLDCGFTFALEPMVIGLYPLDFQNYLEEAVARAAKKMRRARPVEFRLSYGSWGRTRPGLRGRSLVCAFHEGADRRAPILIECDAQCLMDMMMRHETVWRKLYRKELKVRPLSGLIYAVRLLSNMRHEREWHMPSIDWR